MKTVAPIKSKNRVEVLDVIRGFAILGIVIANIQSWSGYKFIPFETLQNLDYYSINDTIKYYFMFIVDTKFYSLFAMLFGIGFYIQFSKQKNNQAEFMPTYRRRLLLLIMFGAIHSFFWSGDILMIYGLVGLVFIMFRNIQEKNMLILAIIFYYIFLLYDTIFALFFPDIAAVAPAAYKTYPDMTPVDLTAIFANGSFFDVLQANWHNLYYRYVDLIPAGKLTKILALFLFGYYLMSINYFTTYARSVKVLFLLIILGVGLEHTAMVIGGSMSSFSHNLNDVLYKFLASTGQIFLAISYINILAILDQNNFFKKFLHLFSYVGRMSFTNYLSHTLLGFLIFYPFFGGLFGTLSLLEISILAILLYMFQILFSFIWLKYFAFGPLEWIWRCLTYSKIFPIVRRKKSKTV